MSDLTDQLASAAIEAQDFLGDSFTLEGQTFRGVFGSINDLETSLESGGFPVDIDAAVVASVAQFTSAGVTPAKGQRLTKTGATYTIKSVRKGPLNYQMGLQSIHQ